MLAAGASANGEVRASIVATSERRLSLGMGLWASRQNLEPDAPSCWRFGPVALAGLIRLYNRADLLQRLNRPANDALPDAAVMGGLWLGHGARCLDWISGDFAFALWDERDGTLSGVTDPFGVKPLFYTETDRGFALTGRLEQMLAAPGYSVRPNFAELVDRLAWSYGLEGSSLLFGVRTVPPGHRLIRSRRGETRLVEYHLPPPSDRSLKDRASVEMEYEERFLSSIRQRIDAGSSVSHLSGGLDSSAVTCGADWLDSPSYKGAIAATYEGLPCDEGRYVKAVERSIRRPVKRWDGREIKLEDLLEPSVEAPDLRYLVCGSGGEFSLVRELGASAILSGEGGDAITEDRICYLDLARQRGLPFVLKALGSLSPVDRASHVRGISYFLSISGPRPLRRHPPKWLTGRAQADFWPSLSEATIPWPWKQPRFESLTRSLLWWSLKNSRNAYFLATASRNAEINGVVYRYPFLDRNLLDFVMSVPEELRLPRGLYRQLPRVSSKARLPKLVAGRRDKAKLSFARRHHAHLAASAIRATLAKRELRIHEIVRPEYVRGLLEGLNRAPEAISGGDAYLVYMLSCIERWLDVILRPRSAETSNMTIAMLPNDLPQAPETAGTFPDKTPAYEPPALEELGNVRELLAGSGGVSTDSIGEQVPG